MPAKIQIILVLSFHFQLILLKASIYFHFFDFKDFSFPNFFVLLHLLWQYVKR